MFLQFIGIAGKTSRTSRQRRLHIRLQDRKVQDSYYVFNRIFDVKFPYEQSNTEDDTNLLTKMFTNLSKRVGP